MEYGEHSSINDPSKKLVEVCHRTKRPVLFPTTVISLLRILVSSRIRAPVISNERRPGPRVEIFAFFESFQSDPSGVSSTVVMTRLQIV